MAAANFAPLHHHHFRRCPSPPNSSSLLISKACFLSRNFSSSYSFCASIQPAKITHGQLVNCSPSPSSTSPEISAATAESCVNLGLSLFAKGRVKDALEQFDTALTLDPNPVEAQAALYNKACCHAYREEAKKAAECLRTALREYDLKFGTILNDPDLASFRAMPEFKELQEDARLGGEDIGYGFRRDLKLISEVQAPFRGIRRFFYVAFTAAAGISLFLTIPRLFAAIKGGDGAPDLLQTSENAGINIGGIIVFVALFLWDNKKEEEQFAQITRNETLSRLPLRLSTNRIVELVQLRDTARPVILAGKKETVDSAMRKAERFRTNLLRRGVILIPVVWGERREPLAEKKGFGLSPKAAASLPSIGEDFDKRTQSVVANSKIKAEIRFRAEVVSAAEWERWIRDQQEAEGITPGEDVYIILRLDGRVRKSGLGMPDWQEIVKEVPPMEDLLSKLER
ncbi:protein LOW PSII ACCUMULATION 1, chloroplastic-like isoform X2 [Salvia splendens]|uniref:protein LOW PSII ACCUMULATION 1, chloroplastic-like isoform X2 n=1 Tax=Salvia splendens TaxID=180675 RepID=UPI001C26ADE2|nr:protein LOW PSII ACCUMULATION 1, chloroplastic-like isoform X2 [Salvia splendens]